MKTTIDIADALLKEAKKLAEREETTVRALVEEGLRGVIKSRKPAKPFKLRDGSVGGKGLNPELKGAPWETIRDIIYKSHGT